MEWVVLPAVALFAQPVADTRSALPTVTLRWDDGFGIDTTLGAAFPVLGFGDETRGLQFGLEAAAFMGFDPGDGLTFGLQTFDGNFGFPISGHWGPWTTRLEWTHTSAHYADGVNKIATEGERPEPPYRAPDSYSREWIRLLGGRTLGPARVYAGGRLVTHDVRGGNPVGVQAGGELFAPWDISPFVAADLQLSSDSDWEPAIAGQIGVAYRVEGRRFRVAAAGRYGPEDTGKRTGLNEAYVGVTFGFDVFE